MKKIPLTQGKVALVDDEDYERVVQYKWNAHYHKPSGNWYARRTIDGLGRQISMHRFIMSAPAGSKVDHIDRDGLNNQRSNLRFATTAQNGANRAKGRNQTTSRYKGVHWYATVGKWKATIVVAQRTIFLGHFELEEDAAKAYDEAAIAHFGEFARTNFELNRGR